ncbi:MAG: haloacid dehalogenase [Candidatus Heimdallarchaeota archaeon]
MNLKNIFSELTKELDDLDQDREEILRISRMIVRDCSIAIKNVHRKEFDHYQEKINMIKSHHEKLLNIVNRNPEVFFKYLKTPEQEYAEAVCFYSIISKKDLPTAANLNIHPLNYVLGLADVIGELRRYALDNIRNSKVDDLNYILEDMDEIYTELFSLDYPSGLTQDLRHKTDQARNIIEKTRGDISLSLQMNDLKKCIKNSNISK